MYKEIEAKAVFYKATQELKINFDYETEKYGICHISLNLRVTAFKPKETIEWEVRSINLRWEKYKKSPDNRNLFLYHYILNKLTDDNAYMLKLISSIKTMNELNKMYISLGDVEFDINRSIKSELRNDYLKRLRDSLKEYALNEFKADLM